MTSLLAAVIILAGAVLLWRLVRSSAGGSTAPGVPAHPGNTDSTAAQGVENIRLESIRSRLQADRNSGVVRLILADLRKLLDTLPAAVASREIQSYLSSGQDVLTDLEITIEAGGGLGDASSLRVFLLDYLGRIDRPAAGAVAGQILSGYTTPDEWAVSLRNFAWANPGSGGEAFLLAKTRLLLDNQTWARNPSTGYLEAFDTIVYAHGTALVPELATLVRDRENRATAHAAYLTLDRLTINEPAIMLKQLVDQPGLMLGREQTRANLFARADVRDPVQRALVEQYLLDPARDAAELVTFAGLYPNANFMISQNLLTTVETPQGGQLAAQDREALLVVEQWQQDPRFERLQPHLTSLHERLATFVRQAGSSPSSQP